MSSASQRSGNRAGGDTGRIIRFRHVANLPVMLSLLFLLQFVPVEHIPCLFGHNPVKTMDCHRGMEDGVQMLPAQDAGWIACCGESQSVVFTIPAYEAKRLASANVGYPDGSVTSVLSPTRSNRPAWPPGSLSSVRSMDRSVVFASLLI